LLDLEPTPGCRLIINPIPVHPEANVQVEVFTSPGCGQCGRAKDQLREIVAGIGNVRWHEVNIVDDIDHAVDLGVLAAPSIAIDGILVFTSLPSARRLRAELLQRMEHKQ